MRRLQMYGRMVIFVLLFVMFIPGSLRAEGSREVERSLEDIFNILLGTIAQGGSQVARGGEAYTEEGLNGRYVVSRFEMVLDRKPTEAELARFRSRLTRGLMSDEEFITTLFNSDEYYSRREGNGAYVERLFRAALDREPRRTEHRLYTDLLARGAITRLQLREELFLDAEFKVMRASRKALAEYGTLPAALREYSLRLQREVRALADQLLRSRNRGSYHLREMTERLQTLTESAGELRELVENGSTDEGLYAAIGEDIRYLIYSINQGMGYNRELDFMAAAWRDAERMGLMLLRFLDYRTGGAGDAYTEPSSGAPLSRRIELRVAEYKGERISGALDPRSGKAREVARYVLDNFNEYTRGKGLSLLEEFELERSLKRVAAGQAAPQNVIIARRGRGNYVIYYFVDL